MKSRSPLKSNLIWLAILALSIFFSFPSFGQDKIVIVKSFESQLSAYPFVFYTPETEFAFGAGGIFTFYTQKNKFINASKISFSGFYSTVKTYEFNLDAQAFFNKNKSSSTLELEYAHTVDRYYGIGNNTPDLGNEEYEMNSYGGILEYQMPPNIMIADRAGLAYEFKNYSVTNRKDNAYLQDDSLIGYNGGIVSGLGLLYIWDTRDNIFYPNNGGFTKARVIFYSKDLGSDFAYSSFEFDSRRYWSIATDNVLAFQSYFHSTSNSAPFFKLPALGGSSSMRGYYRGRYRSNNYFAVQVEYRQFFWWRFGFVAFAGIGDVAEEITQFRLKEFKTTLGFGLRFLFNKEEKINLRMDIAFGKGTNGVYFGIEEAF